MRGYLRDLVRSRTDLRVGTRALPRARKRDAGCWDAHVASHGPKTQGCCDSRGPAFVAEAEQRKTCSTLYRSGGSESRKTARSLNLRRRAGEDSGRGPVRGEPRNLEARRSRGDHCGAWSPLLSCGHIGKYAAARRLGACSGRSSFRRFRARSPELRAMSRVPGNRSTAPQSGSPIRWSVSTPPNGFMSRRTRHGSA